MCQTLFTHTGKRMWKWPSAAHLLRGHPHGNSFLCKRTCFASFWLIIQMDPVNALFLKPGLRVKTFWNGTLGFSLGQRIHILCVSMMPSPHPSTSILNPTTSRNNNNNGGLHACVCAAEDTEPIRVTRAKILCSSATLLSKKRLWTSTSF